MTKISRNERQEIAIERWRKSGGRSIITAGTGFGKTYMAVTIIDKYLRNNSTFPKEIDFPVIVLVPTTALKTSWQKDLVNRGISLDDVLVETIQKISLHFDEQLNCGLFIIDECHRVPSEKFIQVFKRITFKFFLGLTATIKRADGKDLILTNTFPVVDDIPIEECLSNNWIAPCKIYKVVLYPEDIEIYNSHDTRFKQYFSYFNNNFSLAMNMVGEKGYKNREEFLKIKYPNARSAADKAAVRPIVQANAFGFVHEMKMRKQYIHNHKLKTKTAEKIIEHRQDKKIITFSKTIKMANTIKPNVENCFYLHSGKTRKKNRLTLEEFGELPHGVLNSGKMLEEGITVPNLHVGIMISYDSSKISMIQKLGRILRYEEGKQAEMFILVLKGTVEEAWARKALYGLEYQTIDEEQLNNLLNNEEYIALNERNQKFIITV